MYWGILKENAALTLKGLSLTWKASRVLCSAIFLLTVLSALLPMAMAYVAKIIIDEIIAHASTSAVKWVIVEFTLLALQGVVSHALSLLKKILSNRLSTTSSLLILEKASQLELKQFENSQIYDKLHQASRGASTRPVNMFETVLQLMRNSLTITGFAAILLSYNPWIVVAMVIASIPPVIIETRFSTLVFNMQNRRSPLRRKLSYLEFILTKDSHAKEVRILGLAQHLLKLFKTASEEMIQEDEQISRRRAGWAFSFLVLSDLVFYGCYAQMVIATAQGALDLGFLTLYVAAFRQGQHAFQSCLRGISGLYEHNLYMSKFFEFLGIPVGETPPAQLSAAKSSEGIRFENVSFRYPGQSEWVLRNVNLHIPKGESVALVGVNGAGKTTLIKLLCGFYEPVEGQILIDGKKINDWERSDLWRRISVGFQDFVCYQFPFSENVGIGEITQVHNRDQIERAIENSGANEILPSLPNGIETQLGQWFENGKELSGGQWKKISLARAFMREESDILILDEPTSALDAKSENTVFERIRALKQGRTSLIISHRFPLARLADKIVVLDSGQITETGSHDFLMQTQGKYAELFSLQARGYT